MKLNILNIIDEAKKSDAHIDFTGLQPFVFEPFVTVPKNIRSEFLKERKGMVEVLASPFRKFSIEIVDSQPITSDEHGLDLVCIYCEELAVGSYFIMCHWRKINARRAKGYSVLIIAETINAFADSSTGGVIFGDYVNDTHRKESIKVDSLMGHGYILSLIEMFLEILQFSQHGLVNYSGKVTFKNASGRKSIYKPRDVIYISTDPKPTHTHTASGNHIRWQDGWAVRAHWRRLANSEAMGLGRTGERDVKGFTWINNYCKGDSAIPMKIHKVK